MVKHDETTCWGYTSCIAIMGHAVRHLDIDHMFRPSHFRDAETKKVTSMVLLVEHSMKGDFYATSREKETHLNFYIWRFDTSE